MSSHMNAVLGFYLRGCPPHFHERPFGILATTARHNASGKICLGWTPPWTPALFRSDSCASCKHHTTLQAGRAERWTGFNFQPPIATLNSFLLLSRFPPVPTLTYKKGWVERGWKQLDCLLFIASNEHLSTNWKHFLVCVTFHEEKTF